MPDNLTSLTLEGACNVQLLQAAEGEPAKLPRITIDAYNGGIMRPNGYYGDVIVDLAGVKKAGRAVPILKDHDHSQVVGHADVSITADKIIAEGIVSGTGQAAEEVVGAAKNGFPWKASVGLAVERALYLDDDEEAQVNGSVVSGPITVVRQSLLGEISVLPWAADQSTSVNVAARHNSGARRPKEMDKEFKKWLEAQGFNADELTDGQRTALEAAWKADTQHPEPQPAPESDPPEPDDPIALRRALEAAETERIGEIRRICAGGHAELEARAIREGLDPVHVELEVLRAERRSAPAVHTGQHDVPAAQVLEAACAVSGRLSDAENRYDDQTLQAAHDRFRHGIGLQELLMESAWSAGYTGRSFRGDMDGVLRAAFSTKSLSGILSNTANKFLLEGFMYVEAAWREISARRSVNDFKTATSYRMTGDLQFIEVGPAGEIKHGELDEESFTNQAKTYGRMFAITRTDLVNDDLNALTAVPRRIGRGAGLKLNDVFWTAFLDNSTFFTSARGNYIEGSATALDSAALTTGVTAFRKIKDADSKPMATIPRLLLVPPDLEATADELFVSRNIDPGGNTSSKVKQPTANIHAAKYRPVVSVYLSDTSYTGYSTTAWYLLADPMDLATIEVCFLNGRENPVVESADADFNVLGIQMRGYFDFGVNKTEWRAGLKSKGAA